MSVVCLAVFSVYRVRPNAQGAVHGPSLRTQESLLKRLLVLHRLVCDLAGIVVLVAGWRVRVRVVLGEDARAIVDGEDQDRLDAEEGERARHGGGMRFFARAGVNGGQVAACRWGVLVG